MVLSCGTGPWICLLDHCLGRCCHLVEMSADCVHLLYSLAVWTVMPTLVLLPLPQPLSSPRPKPPLPHLLEVPCLLGRCLEQEAMLRLHHLYVEGQQLPLLLAPHLLLFQLVPRTPQPTRCPLLHLLRPQWSMTPAAICSLPYAWVRDVCGGHEVQKNVHLYFVNLHFT